MVTVFRMNEEVGWYVGLTVEVMVAMVFSNGSEPCGQEGLEKTCSQTVWVYPSWLKLW